MLTKFTKTTRYSSGLHIKERGFKNKNGKIHGECRFYNADSDNLLAIINFKNGVIHGKQTNFWRIVQGDRVQIEPVVFYKDGFAFGQRKLHLKKCRMNYGC